MSLIVYERHKYVSTYRTNLSYLQNMTTLQVKLLKEMDWIEDFINTDLWPVPWITFSKEDVEYSVEVFIEFLNKELRRL